MLRITLKFNDKKDETTIKFNDIYQQLKYSHIAKKDFLKDAIYLLVKEYNKCYKDLSK